MTRQVAVVAIVCGIGAGCGAPGADDGDVVETQQALAVSRAAAADTDVTVATKVTVTSRAAATLDAQTASTASASPGGAAGPDLTVAQAGTLTTSPGIITAPALFGLIATADSATVSWADASSNELRFVVYRRDVQGNWQAVHTVPTHDMAGSGNYLWVDTDKSLSAQCYTIAAVNDETQASTPERCTVRPDPTAFPQYPPSEVLDWYGLSPTNDKAWPLFNVGANMYLQYEDRTFGVSLAWTEASQENVKAERQGTIPQRLMMGEAIAIRVWGGGWLAHGTPSFGVELALSDTPVYEWYVVAGAPPGTTLSDGKFALWNKSAHDYLVHGDQTWGIGLNWYQKTFPPDYSNPPPPPGVKTFVLTNCQTEERPVEIWVSDLTAGAGYVDSGRLDPNWSSDGCPTVGEPWTFSPTSGHNYEVRAIDFSAPGCDNAPLDEDSCASRVVAFTGDANGQVLSLSVGN